MSAATPRDFPPPRGEEFAILGRSNVGKSSFINHVLGNRTLARTSKKPGKTTLANFYQLDPKTYWVDFPGYGYARASATEKERWARLIAGYCEKRPNLAGIIWLLDIRHPGTQADLEAQKWLESLDTDVLPVLTKADKLSKSMRSRQAAEFRKLFRFQVEPVLYSINQNDAREHFWTRFGQWRSTLA